MTKGKSNLVNLCFWLWLVSLVPLKLSAQIIEGFEIVNAETGLPIGPLKTNQIINLSKLETRNINIRAIVSQGFTGSVRFWYDNEVFKTENLSPYALAGDISGI